MNVDVDSLFQARKRLAGILCCHIDAVPAEAIMLMARLLEQSRDTECCVVVINSPCREHLHIMAATPWQG